MSFDDYREESVEDLLRQEGYERQAEKIEGEKWVAYLTSDFIKIGTEEGTRKNLSVYGNVRELARDLVHYDGSSVVGSETPVGGLLLNENGNEDAWLHTDLPQDLERNR